MFNHCLNFPESNTTYAPPPLKKKFPFFFFKKLPLFSGCDASEFKSLLSYDLGSCYFFNENYPASSTCFTAYFKYSANVAGASDQPGETNQPGADSQPNQSETLSDVLKSDIQVK